MAQDASFKTFVVACSLLYAYTNVSLHTSHRYLFVEAQNLTSTRTVENIYAPIVFIVGIYVTAISMMVSKNWKLNIVLILVLNVIGTILTTLSYIDKAPTTYAVGVLT